MAFLTMKHLNLVFTLMFLTSECEHVKADLDIQEVYSVLSSRIGTVNIEMELLRNELLNNKELIKQMNGELEDLKQLVGSTQLTSVVEPDKDDQHSANGREINKKIDTAIQVMHKTLAAEKLYLRHVETTLNQTASGIEETVHVVQNTFADKSTEIEKLKKSLENQNAQILELGDNVSSVKVNIDDMNDNMNEQITDIEKSISNIREVMRSLQQGHETKSMEQDTVIQSLSEQLHTTRTELSQKVDGIEGCQSGDNLGVHTSPHNSFPFSTRVIFPWSFRKTPSVVYGAKLLDVGGHVRFNAAVSDISSVGFTIRIIAWSTTRLWGVKVSWMACP